MTILIYPFRIAESEYSAWKQLIAEPIPTLNKEKSNRKEIRDILLKRKKLRSNYLTKVYEYCQEIRRVYDGVYYIWMPSLSEEANPEHQLLYGQKFQMNAPKQKGGDVDEATGYGGHTNDIPGERPGCKCGLELLTNENKLIRNSSFVRTVDINEAKEGASLLKKVEKLDSKTLKDFTLNTSSNKAVKVIKKQIQKRQKLNDEVEASKLKHSTEKINEEIKEDLSSSPREKIKSNSIKIPVGPETTKNLNNLKKIYKKDGGALLLIIDLMKSITYHSPISWVFRLYEVSIKNSQEKFWEGLNGIQKRIIEDLFNYKNLSSEEADELIFLRNREFSALMQLNPTEKGLIKEKLMNISDIKKIAPSFTFNDTSFDFDDRRKQLKEIVPSLEERKKEMKILIAHTGQYTFFEDYIQNRDNFKDLKSIKDLDKRQKILLSTWSEYIERKMGKDFSSKKYEELLFSLYQDAEKFFEDYSDKIKGNESLICYRTWNNYDQIAKDLIKNEDGKIVSFPKEITTNYFSARWSEAYSRLFNQDTAAFILNRDTSFYAVDGEGNTPNEDEVIVQPGNWKLIKVENYLGVQIPFYELIK